MVWGLFPVDPLPGEESYYLFSKGTYKVGRKGCDIIVNKDKGVSRLHAEIIIDAMISMDNMKKSSKIRIRDCSKYGTFTRKPLGSKENVHEFPNKEKALDDADLVSFGTGNATYRFEFVPLVFFVCGLELPRSKELQEKILSIGASMTNKWSSKCTHILLGDNALVNGDLVDAILSKRPFVSHKWIESLAEKLIGNEIPSCSLNMYAPSLTFQGVFVQIADSDSREICLNGYTFIMESSENYQLKKKLQPLLEAFGAQVIPIEEFIPHSQGLDDDENYQVVHVISVGDENHSQFSPNLGSIPKVSEINLICATLSGCLDPAIFVSPPVLVTSTCSTDDSDETVVADSEPEVEITSVHKSSAIRKIESTKEDDDVAMKTKSDDYENVVTEETNEKPRGDPATRFRETEHDKTDAAEVGISDVIFSQDLIIRDTNLISSIPLSPMENQVLNFKRFKKMETQSGNSFYNLVPFSKHPYRGSEYENEGVAESVKEEKKRKRSEAVAEDLFNNSKAKKRGEAGFIQGLFTRRR